MKRATNSSGQTVEVSILCSNQDMAAEKIIKLIFNRWIQENDFGYLIVHFGIDQLDSPAADAYDKLEELKDRMVESRAFKQKQKERANLRNSLARLTDSQNKKQLKFFAELQNESLRLCNVDVDNQTKNTPDFAKAMNTVQRSADRCEQLAEKFKVERMKRENAWNAKIQSCKQDIERLDREISQTVAEESRLQALVEEGYMCLNTAILQNLWVAGQPRHTMYLGLCPKPRWGNPRPRRLKKKKCPRFLFAVKKF